MENFVGEIRLFAGNFAPVGWAFCNGQLLAIQDYSTLYTLVGTTYGGDGQTNFALPDLRGRIPIGQGNGSGLSPRTIGQSAGEEAHTLLANEMPPHNHPATASTANATTITPGPSVLYGTLVPDTQHAISGLYAATTGTAPQLNAAAVSLNGGGTSHDNTMNTLTINYIIATDGIFPTQQ